MRRVALAGSACAACVLMGYAVRGRSSALLAPSVYRGSRRRRALALTFDDGPSEGTNQLLDILARYQIPATFFVCGMNVHRLPAVARTTAAAFAPIRMSAKHSRRSSGSSRPFSLAASHSKQ